MSNRLNNNADLHTCEGIVLDSGDGEFIVKGSVRSNISNPTVMFWAANPPTYLQSYSGSGLPFPNPDIAYENTPNRGAVKANGSKFEFRIRFPNAYYVGLGSQYVEPCVHIKVCGDKEEGKIHTINLSRGIPYRSTTNVTAPSIQNLRTSPMFYTGRDKLPTRTQEQILRDSAYPDLNVMPSNFWGKRPPHE